MDRDELAARYLDQLPYAPYPVQEEALLAWFTDEQGVLVCAPTGTGKTLIAEAALFEALHTGKVAYYTTPLIALTEQKFREMQAAAVRWGFSAEDVGLVTGNRRVNPDAKVLVVVAEILLNRLLHPDTADFEDVSGVVMDEFHSFNDPERGVVWELSLALLPKHVRLLLLSATVGNTTEFLIWLQAKHGRRLELVQGTERKVPLSFNWIGDMLLPDQIEFMVEHEKTPTLLFCFNRNECWDVAEQLKGKSLLASGQQKQLGAYLESHDWKAGAGPRLKQLLFRGVGIHHAGLLPKYRRHVEELFQQKLLSVCVCTETLAAGINLPARSVVMTSLMKGPPGRKTIIDASSAHQIFGRAGRPQFDTQGYVYSLAHEDDVRLAKWKERYDQIPEDTKDFNLIRAKKALKKKMPTRRPNEQYWNDQLFQKLILAPPGKLASKGQLPWRLLAYLLKLSPDVGRLVSFVRKRLLDSASMERAETRLQEMLLTLWAGGFLALNPPPPATLKHLIMSHPWDGESATDEDDFEEPASGVASAPRVQQASSAEDEFGAGLEDDPSSSLSPANDVVSPIDTSAGEREPESRSPALALTFGRAAPPPPAPEKKPKKSRTAELLGLKTVEAAAVELAAAPPPYVAATATPTADLDKLLVFRSVNPIYGAYLLQHLGLADACERIQILESLLEIPTSMIRQVRVPWPQDLPPGPLGLERIHNELISRGLATLQELNPAAAPPQDEDIPFEERKWPIPLGDQMRMLFDSDYPGIRETPIRAVWIIGDLQFFNYDFQKYITSRDLTKQEGLIFRHLMKMILLCGEFSQVTPLEMDEAVWRDELRELAEKLTDCCRQIDPESTDQMLEMSKAADVLLA
ncbi:MAG: helicase [Planctomycetota bacterium]|nr:MAG: helicase [Planctomycetota bacterium]